MVAAASSATCSDANASTSTGTLAVAMMLAAALCNLCGVAPCTCPQAAADSGREPAPAMDLPAAATSVPAVITGSAASAMEDVTFSSLLQRAVSGCSYVVNGIRCGLSHRSTGHCTACHNHHNNHTNHRPGCAVAAARSRDAPAAAAADGFLDPSGERNYFRLTLTKRQVLWLLIVCLVREVNVENNCTTNSTNSAFFL